MIDAEASKFGIIYQINGKQRGGVLSRFSGIAIFDPDALEEAELNLVIDMDSIDVGDRFGTAIIKTSDWFDVYSHPVSTYRLNELVPLGDDKYRALGTLTMRGKSADVEGTLSIVLSDGEAATSGRSEFARSTFGIGVGFTALFVEVGDGVAVDFELVARPVE
jgi:polyisoprenoid-binding protein YceI